jgi:hypothetical protein
MKKILVLVLLFISVASFQVTYASSTGIIGPEVIHKQSNKILTTSDILSMYSSELGGVTIQQDGYTGYGNILGSYQIKLYASDGSTIQTKDIEVRVIATLGNVTAVADYNKIHLTTKQLLSPSDIVYVLEKTEYLEITATTQMVILNNTYTTSRETPGNYLFEFRLVNSAGLDQIYIAHLIVSDERDQFVPDIIFEAPPSIFSNIGKQIWNLIQIIIVVVGVIIVVKILKKRKRGGLE